LETQPITRHSRQNHQGESPSLNIGNKDKNFAANC